MGTHSIRLFLFEDNIEFYLKNLLCQYWKAPLEPHCSSEQEYSSNKRVLRPVHIASGKYLLKSSWYWKSNYGNPVFHAIQPFGQMVPSEILLFLFLGSSLSAEGLHWVEEIAVLWVTWAAGIPSFALMPHCFRIHAAILLSLQSWQHCFVYITHLCWQSFVLMPLLLLRSAEIFLVFPDERWKMWIVCFHLPLVLCYTQLFRVSKLFLEQNHRII